MEISKKQYSGIDIGKLICAVLVVVLHAVETSSFFPCEIKFVFTRFAVPFFFMCSGFFFERGISRAEDEKKYFIRYEKHLLIIFAIWTALYFPFTLASYIQNNPGASVIKITLLLIRRMFVIGAGPFWYLLAMILSVPFLYFCKKRDSNKLLVFATVMGLLLALLYTCFQGALSQFTLYQYYRNAVYVVFSWENNFIMYGIPFMGIGYLISKCNVNVTVRVSATALVVTTLLRFFEFNLPVIFPGVFWENNDLSVAFIFQAIAFFLLMKEISPGIKQSTSLTIRSLSATIYYTHVFFLYELLNPVLLEYTSLPVYADWMIAPKVFAVLLLCTAFYITVRAINNKKLNILING